MNVKSSMINCRKEKVKGLTVMKPWDLMVNRASLLFSTTFKRRVLTDSGTYKRNWYCYRLKHGMEWKWTF
ncbi:MAG: hypothetical protein K0Q49_2085 [Haloplasmataceae bacterium]|nr:hypothetical protein [Haloplasmataceae bacterium]